MTALTDALDWWERKARPPTGGFARLGDWRYLHVLAAVARRVADAPEWLQQLLENPESAEPVPWCDIHGGKFRFEDRCDGADVLNLDVCRMVRMLLVSPGTRPRGRHARQEDQWKD